MTRLIVTDLDKTLLNDKKEITAYTADILQKCRECGIITAFATARPERATMSFQQMFKPDFVISNNGATISGSGEVIENKLLQADVCGALISALVNIEEVTLITAEAGDRLYTNYRGKPWDNENWNTVYTDFSEPLDAPISKISAECKDIELINAALSHYSCLHLYANSGEDWSQIMRKDATKMNAIRFIAETLEIKTEDIIAFGDDFNDVEMLRVCGTGVAVDNAIEQAKLAADYICPCNNNDGAAKWIKENLLTLDNKF